MKYGSVSAPMNPPYDVLGIGFGPSNLALAIALLLACGELVR